MALAAVEEWGTMVLLAKIDLTALAEEFAKQVLKCLLQYVWWNVQTNFWNELPYDNSLKD